MAPVHDLRCTTCGTFIPDVECRLGPVSEGQPLVTPACACGGATTVSWEGGVAPTVKLFASRVVGSRDDGSPIVIDSKAAEERMVAHIRARHPTAGEIHIEPDSKAQQKQRADEARHMARTEEARMGVDATTRTAQTEMIEAVKAEAEKAAAKANVDPAAAGHAAMAAVPTAAALAGAVS